MLSLIVFGWICFKRLGISQMPDVDFPVLSVQVTWEGAAPDVIESEIVDRLEQTIITVEGIHEISSTIRQGQATLSVEFDLERDVDAALQEVQSAISRVKLPSEVDPPTIRKSNPEDQPIIWLGISSTTKDLHELIRFVDLNIKDQFQILSGVGEVTLSGFTERSLRVWVDNTKLKKFDLSILDVRTALERGHFESAAGVIENSQQELNLRVMGEGSEPSQVGDILIPSRGGKPIFGTSIRINDVARVADGLADIRRISRFNGVTAVGLGIKKQRGSNAVEVGDRVKQKMSEVAKTLPSDMSIAVNFDSTVFVRESIEETKFTLLLSAIVTGVVCWFFLGSIRPTINILLSIPTSIIGSFIVVYFLGFTLNLFTILALTLAIGIVVDDAIMVLENIYRHKSMGKDKVQASLDGAEEIVFAAVAATIAVVAIFLPVAFMKGVIGKFFFQFGVTLSTAVLLSLLEAVTLTPMRCSEIMEDGNKEGWYARLLNRLFARFAAIYRALLRFCLKLRWLVILGAIAVFYWSLTLFPGLKKEFLPPQDQGNFIARLEAPVGSSLEFTSQAMKQAEEYLRSRPDVLRIFVAVGGFGGGEVNTGMMFVTLKPRSERTLSQMQIMQEVREKFKQFSGLKAFLQDLSTRGFTAQRGFPVEVNIRGADWQVLSKASQEIVEKLSATGLAADVNTDYRLGQPEVRVWPQREAAAMRGVSIQTLSETINAAVGGIRQGKYTQDGRRYDVRLRLEGDERLKPDDILSLDVRNVHGELVPMRDLVRLETVPTLQTITRRNRERSIAIYANVAADKSQAEALEVAQKIAAQVLPDGYRVFLGGGAKTFQESFESLYFVLWLGVVVAYMVLASQFNSFIHPLSVLVSLPFSITGALVALNWGGYSINLYSVIGIVLLMGIVKKNAILLVEFTNHKRFEGGMSLREALLEACPIRLRPILMTSFATLAAAVPPALALGPGAETRIPMAVTIVGGVIVSTVFTLFVVPCVYYVLTALERHRKI